MLNRYTLAGLVSVLGVVGIVALAFAAFGSTDQAAAPTPTPSASTARTDDLAEAGARSGPRSSTRPEKVP